ncbi:FG-GAP-like repeat-containing protein [Streptomyces sp. NPDC000594]|uniref:FG-GAP-like repeat-containing protein n=1 Tax=Streptomyces sp. NPDC000594 TaxID=3154261 RepID=UPI00332CD145
MKASRTRRASGVAVAIAVAGALTAPVAHALPAGAPAVAPVPAKAKKAKPEDFNGDGYRDVVVPATGATVNGREGAGYVAVLYGSRSGGPLAKKQIVHQDSAGVPDQVEAGDGFGAATTTGDFDGDGYTDLAVAAPGEDIGTTADAGTVAVVWGGPKGLSGATTVMNGATAADRLGSIGVAGDFDGDGDQDLVVAERNRDLRQIFGPFGRDGATAGTVIEENEFKDFGISDLAAGDLNADGRTDLVANQYYFGDFDGVGSVYRMGTSRGLGAAKGFGDHKFGGSSVDIGDINKDGYADVVIGRNDDGSDASVGLPYIKGGMITYIPGAAKGPIPARARHFNQDSPGVPGAAEGPGGPDYSDNFGAGVSIGDVDGDGYGDIAAGVPGESFDGIRDAGAVVVLRGTKDGPTGKGARVFSQDTPGVPGVAEAEDGMGWATTIVDIDGDRRGELFVGAPNENRRSGAVTVLDGTASGTTAKGAVTFGAGSLGTHAAKGVLGGGFPR